MLCADISGSQGAIAERDGLLLENSGNQVEMSGQVRRPADVNEISKEVRVQLLS